MATSIEERLLDRIENRLETITVANGYHQDVASVTRASKAPAPTEHPAVPALQVRLVDVQPENLIRGARECLAEIHVVCTAAADAADENISRLMGDVQKVVEANKRWNDGSFNLARRTWVGGTGRHETETDEAEETGVVQVFVVFRVDALDPYALKEI